MQKKKKKRLVIISIITAVLALILLLVYFGVNSLFSMVGDSFYQSEVTIESAGETTSAEEPSVSGEAPDETEPAAETSGQEKSPVAQSADKTERTLPFDKLNLTSEEFKTLQKQVPFADKMAALAILSKGLSAADYTELIGMLGGGITSSEVKRAYSIVSRGLSSEDKAKIWGYYDKYKYLIQ